MADTGSLMKKILFTIIFIFTSFCFAENVDNYEVDKKTTDSNIATNNTENTTQDFAELPQGYRGLTIGMNIEAVKEALKEDSIFGYRGERDVSLLAGKNRSLIETNGLSNIKHSWFQFYEEKLYIITLQMNTDKIDYYSVYSALCKKYGEPNKLDPKRAVWENSNIKMILERPLVLKYIDEAVFNDLIEKSTTDKNYTDVLREEFINEF